MGEGLPNSGVIQEKGPASKPQSHQPRLGRYLAKQAITLDYFCSSPFCMYGVLRNATLVLRVRNDQLMSKYGYRTALYFFTLFKCAELGTCN